MNLRAVCQNELNVYILIRDLIAFERDIRLKGLTEILRISAPHFRKNKDLNL